MSEPQSDTPSPAEVIRRALDARLSGLHVAMPAKVVSYDSTTQEIVAQPLIKRPYTDEAGVRQVELLPVIDAVPVAFQGGGGFRVTFPVAVNDTVLLVFGEQSMERWLFIGGEVDPQDERRHALSDAIAIPGLRDYTRALNDAPTNAMSMGDDVSGTVIEIDSTEVRLGSKTASDPVVLKSELSQLEAWAEFHVHPSPAGGLTSKPTATPPYATGATRVKGV